MTINEIKRLGRKRSKSAVQSLRKEIRALQAQANRQITYLEKYRARTGLEQRSTALGKAELYLHKRGLIRFSADAFDTASALSKQLLQIKSFLSNPTSTVSGLKQRQKNIVKKIEKSINAQRKENSDLESIKFRIKKSEYDEFLEFISTDFVQEMKDFDSGRIFYDVLEAIRSGKTLEDLENAWESYKNGKGTSKLTADQAWEQWTGVNPFLPRKME